MHSPAGPWPACEKLPNVGACSGLSSASSAGDVPAPALPGFRDKRAAAPRFASSEHQNDRANRMRVVVSWAASPQPGLGPEDTAAHIANRVLGPGPGFAPEAPVPAALPRRVGAGYDIRRRKLQPVLSTPVGLLAKEAGIEPAPHGRNRRTTYATPCRVCLSRLSRLAQAASPLVAAAGFEPATCRL